MMNISASAMSATPPRFIVAPTTAIAGWKTLKPQSASGSPSIAAPRARVACA